MRKSLEKQEEVDVVKEEELEKQIIALVVAHVAQTLELLLKLIVLGASGYSVTCGMPRCWWCN